MNVEGGSSSYGGVIPRSRSSSGQALYMGLNGDGYQRSTSRDDGSGQVQYPYIATSCVKTHSHTAHQCTSKTLHHATHQHASPRIPARRHAVDMWHDAAMEITR